VRYLVMELLRGDDLRRTLAAEAPLALAHALALLLPVFSAVEAAHTAGIVHRDLDRQARQLLTVAPPRRCTLQAATGPSPRWGRRRAADLDGTRVAKGSGAPRSRCRRTSPWLLVHIEGTWGSSR
jgi:hypothetical protein